VERRDSTTLCLTRSHPWNSGDLGGPISCAVAIVAHATRHGRLVQHASPIERPLMTKSAAVPMAVRDMVFTTGCWQQEQSRSPLMPSSPSRLSRPNQFGHAIAPPFHNPLHHGVTARYAFSRCYRLKRSRQMSLPQIGFRVVRAKGFCVRAGNRLEARGIADEA